MAKTNLLDLPVNILVNILSYIPLVERLQHRLVCRDFKNVVETQLSVVKTLVISGRVMDSVLFFVKNAKARETVCGNKSHSDDILNTMQGVDDFEIMSVMINKYFTGLVFLRLHRLRLSYSSLKTLALSSCWSASLEHLVIRCCKLEWIEDNNWKTWLTRPKQLKHFCLVAVTKKENTVHLFSHVIKDLKDSRELEEDIICEVL